MTPVIRGLNIHKRYRKHEAVNGIDFMVYARECFGILGPNGAGKTSLMKMLYNLVNRDGGTLEILGSDPSQDEVLVKSRMGIVPQEDNLDPDLNVIENLEIYSNYFSIPRKVFANRIRALLNFFDLSGKENYPLVALSGGMKRRLVIIRSLINSPEILLLDEPTTGLDPAARHLIWDKLIQLKKEGLTIILTTHYMEEAGVLCDRLMIMDKGKKIIEGNPEKLMKEHFERFVLETDAKYPVSTGLRYEKHGNRLFLYSNQQEELLCIREQCLKDAKVIIRNASLEDLFLRLTGRNINE